jgi:hypothetical protein
VRSMFSPKRRRPPAASRADLARADGDSRLIDLITLQSVDAVDAVDLDRLLWSNEQSTTFRYSPTSFLLSVDLSGWRKMHPLLDAVELDLPASWVTDRPRWRPCPAGTNQLVWTVSPREEPNTLTPSIAMTALAGRQALQTIGRSIAIEIHGMSQFEPARDAFQEVNSVSGWGVVIPREEVFQRTYQSTLFPKALFDGLYRSIVFIGGNLHGYGGGLCTGMARAALERSFGHMSAASDLDEVLLWHGRQLTDRALLASAHWFLLPSPRRAFDAFKRDLLRTGETRRCFDIDVPKPWRRDIVDALQREGHTVVPYAFRQSEPGRADVSVYDPNDPHGSIAGNAVLTFDLARDTYAYRGLVSLDDHRTTVIAVEQSAYRRGRTALLSGLASAVLRLGNSVRLKRAPA